MAVVKERDGCAMLARGEAPCAADGYPDALHSYREPGVFCLKFKREMPGSRKTLEHFPGHFYSQNAAARAGSLSWRSPERFSAGVLPLFDEICAGNRS